MHLLEHDTEAIRRVVAEADRLQNDADGFASLLAEDAVLVNAIGRRIFGREAIRDALRAGLRTPLANVYTRYEIVDIHPVRPDAVLVSGVKHVSGEGSAHAKTGSTITLSLVLVKDGGEWRIALAHNTLVPARD